MKKLVLFPVVVTLWASTALAGQGTGVPPIATILNIDGIEVDTITVDAGETFTLIGVASGDNPLSFTWYQDSAVAATGSPVLSDYSIAVPGIHEIVLVVVDVNSLADSDTCYAVVAPVPVPTRDVSWGAVKELYRLQ